MINIPSQIEKQILRSELKDHQTGEGSKTKNATVLTNRPASHRPSQNRFISLRNI